MRTVAGDPAGGLALRAQEALRRGQYQEAETLHDQVLAVHEKALGEQPTTATSISNLGSVLYLQGRYPAAEAAYRRALVMREKLLGAEHPDVATSLNNLANVLQELNKDQQVLASEQRARASGRGWRGRLDDRCRSDVPARARYPGTDPWPAESGHGKQP